MPVIGKSYGAKELALPSVLTLLEPAKFNGLAQYGRAKHASVMMTVVLA